MFIQFVFAAKHHWIKWASGLAAWYLKRLGIALCAGSRSIARLRAVTSRPEIN
jgi:hypothetical protein